MYDDLIISTDYYTNNFNDSLLDWTREEGSNSSIGTISEIGGDLRIFAAAGENHDWFSFIPRRGPIVTHPINSPANDTAYTVTFKNVRYSQASNWGEGMLGLFQDNTNHSRWALYPGAIYPYTVNGNVWTSHPVRNITYPVDLRITYTKSSKQMLYEYNNGSGWVIAFSNNVNFTPTKVYGAVKNYQNIPETEVLVDEVTLSSSLTESADKLQAELSNLTQWDVDPVVRYDGELGSGGSRAAFIVLRHKVTPAEVMIVYTELQATIYTAPFDYEPLLSDGFTTGIIGFSYSPLGGFSDSLASNNPKDQVFWDYITTTHGSPYRPTRIEHLTEWRTGVSAKKLFIIEDPTSANLYFYSRSDNSTDAVGCVLIGDSIYDETPDSLPCGMLVFLVTSTSTTPLPFRHRLMGWKKTGEHIQVGNLTDATTNAVQTLLALASENPLSNGDHLSYPYWFKDSNEIYGRLSPNVIRRYQRASNQYQLRIGYPENSQIQLYRDLLTPWDHDQGDFS